MKFDRYLMTRDRLGCIRNVPVYRRIHRHPVAA